VEAVATIRGSGAGGVGNGASIGSNAGGTGSSGAEGGGVTGASSACQAVLFSPAVLVTTADALTGSENTAQINNAIVRVRVNFLRFTWTSL
jgi:hypothetical protein